MVGTVCKSLHFFSSPEPKAQDVWLRMSYCDHSSSVVRLSTPLNNFSSETPGPIFFKFLLEPSVNGGLKIYTNGLSLLIKLAAMPICTKNI